jgi:hypothetical protein
VTAHIEEGPQPAGFAQHDDALAGHLGQEEVAARADPIGAADADPAAREDALLLNLE